MNLLLSIKPEYADKIFSGEKKFEYRKISFRRHEVDRAIVYSTMPVGQIIGEFGIRKIWEADKHEIWNETKEHAGIDEEFFFEYYKNKKLAVAIEIINPILYIAPINPKEKDPDFVAPQSFMYEPESMFKFR